jgi:hypothetical protein
VRTYHASAWPQTGDKYCGQAYKDAGSEEVEIACQRDHTPIHLPAHRMKPSACWGVRWLVD